MVCCLKFETTCVYIFDLWTVHALYKPFCNVDLNLYWAGNVKRTLIGQLPLVVHIKEDEESFYAIVGEFLTMLTKRWNQIKMDQLVRRFSTYWYHIASLVQDGSISSALAIAILQSCTKSSILDIFYGIVCGLKWPYCRSSRSIYNNISNLKFKTWMWNVYCLNFVSVY